MKTQSKLTLPQSRINKTVSMYQESVNSRLSEPKMHYKPLPVSSYFEKDFDQTKFNGIPQARKTFYH